jgi:exosortase/archaeosortase family protein
VSLTVTSASNLRSRTSLQEGILSNPLLFVLVLLLTLGAIAADQFAAPIIFSSSPLWAVTAGLVLVWRRVVSFEWQVGTYSLGFTGARIAAFVVAHVALVLFARAFNGTLGPVAGSFSAAGWTIAALKLSVLLPTLLLLPLERWRIFARAYAAEGIGALVVLFTFFPSRVIAAAWPWYGQVLGKVVFSVAWLFVPGLKYTGGLTPTLHGPDLDVSILLACSGISGIELFDWLFAFVAVLDWNRLRKGRTLAAYFVGIAVMFLGNALRIAFLVVLGNRGFVDAVARYHLSAGWIFFSLIFLVFLAVTYRRLLTHPGQPQRKAEPVRI